MGDKGVNLFRQSLPPLANQIKNDAAPIAVWKPGTKSFDIIAVAENEDWAIGQLLQREMTNRETHLAHVAGLEPVLGYLFKLLVDERIRAVRSIVTVNTARVAIARIGNKVP